MSEREFLRQGGVVVTQARFIHGSQTFAMSNVTSVLSTKTDPSKGGAILLIVLGIVLIAAHQAATIVIGLALAALGGWWLYSMKPTYNVVLRTASGESRAFSSKDRSLVERVVAAVNDAIVARG
jgi:hypothetical protein